MSEGLSNAEREFVDFCQRQPIMFHIGSKISLLERELRRGVDAAERPPQALAIRAAVTADLIEQVERVHTFLGGALEKLEALQREQIGKL